MTILQSLRPRSRRGHVLVLASICLLIVTLALVALGPINVPVSRGSPIRRLA